MEWIAIGVVKLANPNRAKKDQRAYERSMWKNGKKKKKQTNKNWTKSVPQAQGSERELFVRKTNSAIDLFERRSFVFLSSVIFRSRGNQALIFFVFHTNSWVLWF